MQPDFTHRLNFYQALSGKWRLDKLQLASREKTYMYKQNFQNQRFNVSVHPVTAG